MTGLAVLTYLVMLPASTWLLGCLLALRDLPDMAPALGRLARAGIPFLGAAVLLGRDAALPSLLALGTSLLLHVGWTTGMAVALQRGWLTDDEDA